nr:alpha/beta hydrolase [Candidatus Sigynarchaeota archaeon]
MVAEKAFKAYEKRKTTYVLVQPWMDWKSKQRDDSKRRIRIEESWIPCSGSKWGHDLHVTTYAPLDALKIKGVAVCFHGLGNFGEREYYYFAPWLADHGFIAFVPDMPYFGHNIIHRGAHGRIGSWNSQIEAMTTCVSWSLQKAGTVVGSTGLPWIVVGISMSGLGVLDWGINQFNEQHLDPKVMGRCNGIAALVPALEFRIKIHPIKKFLGFIVGKLAPNYVFDQKTPPDTATSLAKVSHDKLSVQWCVPCIETGSMFGLEGDKGTASYEVDCFPGSPVSTLSKLYLAANRVRKTANKWPRVPLLCTGSGKDDLVDPAGASEFLSRIDQSIPHQYIFHEGWYHPQLGELDREELFKEILAFSRV